MSTSLKRTGLRRYRLLVTLLLMVASGCVWAGTRTDVITRDVLTGSSTSYQSWTSSGSASTAVYAGITTGGTGAVLKLKANDNSSSPNAGIVSTISGGRLKSITVVWYGTSTNEGATLEIYGKGAAYEGVGDLYAASSKKGTKLGELVKVKDETSATLDITGDYTYVGLRAKDGSTVCFFDEIQIEWESDSYSDPSSKTATQTTFIDGKSAHSVILGESFTAPTAVVTETASSNAVSGATVTYKSSIPGVATVNENTGAVSILATGTTIITASYAGDETYEASSATYTLTVNAFGEFTWDATQQGYENGTSLTTVTDETDPVQIVFSKGEGSNAPAYSTETNKAVCFYANNTLKVSALEGYAINGISISFCDSYAYTIGTNVGSVSIAENVGTWTGISPYVVLKNASGIQSNFSSITVSYAKLSKVGEVTVKSVGVATYCPVGQTVVVGDGTKTYIYTGVEANGTTLTEEALPVVPQGTGVMIAGTSGETTTYNLYSSEALTATAPSSNMLVGVTADNTVVPTGAYVLQNGTAGLAFYYVDGTVNIKVNAGKAYLKGDANQAKAALFFQGGAEPNVMGIPSVSSDEGSVEAIYNLQGIQQDALQRGINIIRLTNGKTIKRILP